MSCPQKLRKNLQNLLRKKETSLPATVDEFSKHAGEGLEKVSPEDLIIPRISILQKLSPQVDEETSAYIKGAKPGTICDVGLNELIQTPCRVIPVNYVKTWIEWAPAFCGSKLGCHS